MKLENIFVLDDETVEYLRKWARDKKGGGWQHLCARVLGQELLPKDVKAFSFAKARIARCLELGQLCKAYVETQVKKP